MTNQYPNQQPAPGIPNVNQPAPAHNIPPQTGEVVQERTVPTNAQGSTAVEPKKKNGIASKLWWLLPLILVPILALLAWLVFGDRVNDTDGAETTNTEVVETATEELDPAPAPIEDQNPVITETLDPIAPVDPNVPPAVNPDGAVAPEAPAPEQAPQVVDPVVPGADELAPAPAPAPAQ